MFLWLSAPCLDEGHPAGEEKQADPLPPSQPLAQQQHREPGRSQDLQLVRHLVKEQNNY